MFGRRRAGCLGWASLACLSWVLAGVASAQVLAPKVETVDVDQSVLGRLLGFGTIHVHGTGQGIENLRRVASPLRLRDAITAR